MLVVNIYRPVFR